LEVPKRSPLGGYKPGHRPIRVCDEQFAFRGQIPHQFRQASLRLFHCYRCHNGTLEQSGGFFNRQSRMRGRMENEPSKPILWPVRVTI
jgi:hypothetical protein